MPELVWTVSCRSPALVLIQRPQEENGSEMLPSRSAGTCDIMHPARPATDLKRTGRNRACTKLRLPKADNGVLQDFAAIVPPELLMEACRACRDTRCLGLLSEYSS